MFSRLSRISFIFCCLGIVFCSMFPAEKASSQVTSKYKKELGDEWECLKNQMFDALGITKKDWISFKDKNIYKYTKYENNLKKDRENPSTDFSKKIKVVIVNLLKDFTLKNKDISVIRCDDKVRRLSSSDNVVYASEENLCSSNASNYEIEASFLHEFNHILHGDDCFNYLLELLMKEKTTFLDTILYKIGKVFCQDGLSCCGRFKILYKKIRHFQEKRADILSGLHSIYHAKALLHFYQRLSQQSAHKGETNTHPSLFERVDYMQKLCNDLEAANS